MVKRFVIDSKKQIILLLDAYFANATAFDYVYDANKETEKEQIILIARAKSNAVGYKLPEKSDKKRVGRPKKYGDSIKFKDMFKNNFEGATKAVVKLYDKKEEIEYLCFDVL